MKEKIKTTLSSLIALFWMGAIVFVMYQGAVLIHENKDDWFDTAQDTYEDGVDAAKDLFKDTKKKIKEVRL